MSTQSDSAGPTGRQVNLSHIARRRTSTQRGGGICGRRRTPSMTPRGIGNARILGPAAAAAAGSLTALLKFPLYPQLLVRRSVVPCLVYSSIYHAHSPRPPPWPGHKSSLTVCSYCTGPWAAAPAPAAGLAAGGAPGTRGEARGVLRSTTSRTPRGNCSNTKNDAPPRTTLYSALEAHSDVHDSARGGALVLQTVV